MEVVKGTVQRFFENEWRGMMLYGLTVDTDERMFGTGEIRPSTAVGDYVSFEVNKGKNDKWYANTKSLQVLTEAPATPQKANGATSPAKTKENYWTNKEANDKTKDKVIQYQSCRNSAIALIGVLLSNGALTLPQKKEAKYDVVVALAEKLTIDFFTTNSQVVDGSHPPVDTDDTMDSGLPSATQEEEELW